MKRKDALRKVRAVCERLSDAGDDFPVIPVRLYLFGSVLTEKPAPRDVDLLFEYKERPDLDADDIVYRLSYRKPLPHDQAIKRMRAGMKMVRIDLILDSLEGWLASSCFPADTPIRLVWKPGLDWRKVVDDVEVNPLPWNPEEERLRKERQEKLKELYEERRRNPELLRDYPDCPGRI